ncbi:hypothetical protein C8R43DRAFT_910062 [Mycena crocata]|nr:hypothetical protein C8R43DRAFT_910062 [Mycena crocata]
MTFNFQGAVGPSRHLIGSVVYWYDNLRVLLNRQVEIVTTEFVVPHQPDQSNAPWPSQNTDTAHNLYFGRAHHDLSDRCPACFGPEMWGRSFNEGGDVHCEVDATFSLPHNKEAGLGFSFSNSVIFLEKSEVDAVGRRIDSARKKARRTAIRDVCARSHNAAKEGGWKFSTDKFDEKGIMVCSCRHGVPLLAARIDTPGEQQKYVVALYEHLLRLLPRAATMVLLYDIGCLLDYSLNLYEFSPNEYRDRLLLCTSAMHAYGHQWRCQIIYNPRLRPGIGLTDGEGVERIWSKLRFLICTTRSQSAARRIWALERQLLAIGETQRNNLGKWIQKRNTMLQAELRQSWESLVQCNVTIYELRAEWRNQLRSQISNQYFVGEEQLNETIEKYIIKMQMEEDSENLSEIMIGAEWTTEKSTWHHVTLTKAVRAEISRLGLDQKILDQFSGVDIEFIQQLLMTRILKQRVRGRAVGSFFEYDRLAQSKSGKQAALGNQVYMQTTKGIAKRRPALVAAINLYNRSCKELEKLYKATYNIPIPSQLSTNIKELQNDPSLMEDIWMGRSEPRWLQKDVRTGIQAMLKGDRCVEEHKRISREAYVMKDWARKALFATRRALKSDLTGALG